MRVTNSPYYYFNQLSEREQSIYNHILRALSTYNGTISLPYTEKLATVKRIVRSLHLDRPSLFYVHFWTYRAKKANEVKTADGNEICGLHFQFCAEESSILCVSNELREVAKEICQKIEAKESTEEKYLEIIRAVVNTTVYNKTGNYYLDHSISGPLMLHTGVCEAMAKFMLILCQTAGLPCWVVSGDKGGGHAWNCVQIDGEKRYVDPTALRNKRLTAETVFHTREEMERRGYCPRFI